MTFWRAALHFLIGQPLPGAEPAAQERVAGRRERLARVRPATLWSLLVTALREITLALLGQPSHSAARRRRPRR
ncbi:hypothetical protein [Deinococcus daejeonensis]|uniref:Uncharacterized protein n=1 Tax=Deinococcus daejeonensis TaxID=1007098 RepID=A0ABQ2IVG7_9DEIO|nr:hypothetical protein [Deinococcus daejeonensis]GGN28414.1 hypothetical protein GCM10010842_02130 [Deinococcus daejeonensis]